MRGRSLLKEPNCLSLCAFCAHRLRQAARRPPSHVQRRFLQSSRPVAKPPAEATALRDVDNVASQPSWGRPGQTRPTGLGPQPTGSWGSGGGIPAGPPRPTWGASGIPPAPGRISPGPAQQQNTASDIDDLLPHERKAREKIVELEKARKAEQERLAEIELQKRRPILRFTGSGSQNTRGGRYEPRIKTDAERREEAEREKARAKAYAVWNKKKQENLDNVSIRPVKSVDVRYTHVMGDKDSSIPSSRTNDKIDNVWGQLKTSSRTLNAAEPSMTPTVAELKKSPAALYQEGRAEREEATRSGKYTPLGRTFGHGMGQGAIHSRSGSRSLDLSRSFPDPSSRQTQSVPLDSKPTFKRPTSPKEDNIVSYTSMAPPSNIDRPPIQKEIISKAKPAEEEEEEEGESRPGRKKEKKRRGQDSGKLSFDAMPKGKDKDKAKRRQGFGRTEEDELAEEAALDRAEAKRLRREEKAARKAEKAAAATPILLPEYISVSNLAMALKVRLEDFVYKMEELGFEETSHDHVLNAETSGLIAQEYNFDPVVDRGDAQDLKARPPPRDPSNLPPRSPVVTIMGHVDHGKTTLLDYLRKSSVAAGEHGGITQHIGAFSVPMPSGKVITFLDTPGHAAFLSMRQRGANVTDIVILVVAADDSVKPQTIEAINHAKAAKVPIIVAINKIDKEDSNVDRVKQDLARHGVDIEDFGGDTQIVCVSGKTGQGMDELEEAAVTLSEILDMRAERDGPAEGWVIEASIKSMGKVATVLVRRGTMRPGDSIVAGKTWARIRCLRNEAGVEIDEAGPGTPVEIDGWREQPLAGDEVLQATDEAHAKIVMDFRLEKDERNRLAEDMEAINENRKVEQEKRDREKMEAAAAAEADADVKRPETVKSNKPSGPKEIFFIVKGDVSGSVEAVIDSIASLGNNEVRPHILRSGVGQLSEFDIEHAAVANGLLINFNTTIEPNIARLAEESKVSIMDHNIIYRLVDDVKAELSKHIPPLITQKVMGEADIAQIFSINIKGRQQKPIAGCKVRNGTISKTAKVRVLRGGKKVYDGTLESLKNVKKDVPEIKKGGECGIGFDDWFDFKVGDQIQSYEEIHEKRYL